MSKPPGLFQSFVDAYPSSASAYEELGKTSREAAGFGVKDAELLKLALSLGRALEGAVHSHTRRALAAGAGPLEVRGVALLAITTLGFPHAMMGLSWVEDVLRDQEIVAAAPAEERHEKKRKKGKLEPGGAEGKRRKKK